MDATFDGFCSAFGKRVRQLRLDRDLTQEDMMDRGFSLRHYQRIEAGRSVTLRTIWKLARAFEVSPADFLGNPVRGAQARARRGKGSARKGSR